MGLKGKLIRVLFSGNVRALLGVAICISFMFFSTVCLGEFKYFVKCNGEEGSWTQVDPPTAISCESGKVFDKDTKEWVCADLFDCLTKGESSQSKICGKMVWNMAIQNENGGVLIFGAAPGYLPW